MVAYLALTTVLGAALSGKQATIRDFFLGGRKLPWLAVAGSIVATEISAVTLIGVPANAFAQGGNLTYLQLGLGAVLARVIIGIWFVPAFYEREIYSPYEYLGNWLGGPARRVTTFLFILGSLLGQSVRVLLAGLILEQVSGLRWEYSIWIIGAAAVAWSLIGGITTVIWTEVMQFFIFLSAMAGALFFIVHDLPGGWRELWTTADAAGKLRMWDLSVDPHKQFTLWTGLIGSTTLCLAAYGVDQHTAQRMFCCRGPRPARKAIIASTIGQVVAVIAVFVGIGLYAYYQRFPLDPAAAAAVEAKHDRIFPHYIVTRMPTGLVGLVIAGIFSAAISTLESVLAALAQTVVTGLYKPWLESRGAAVSQSSRSAGGRLSERHLLRVSHLLVVGWAVVLCGVAHITQFALERYGDVLNLALSMAAYTGGTLLAAFLLALWRVNVNWRGIAWAAPLSVTTVFAITWHATWAQVATVCVIGAVALAWFVDFWRRKPQTLAWGRAVAIASLLSVCALALCASFWRLPSGAFIDLAWPWNVPIGLLISLWLGVALAERRGDKID